MSEKTKNIFMIGVVVITIFATFSLFSGSDNYNVNIQSIDGAAEGLDLKVVGDLAIKAKSAEEFEKKLNSQSEGVNNLDLDENGSVDYIQVDEYGSGNMRGLSLSVEMPNGEEQEVATIEFEKDANGTNVQTHGNPQVYGHNHYHHSHFGIGDYLLLRYLFSPHPFYSSPFHYGYYPSHYSSYSPRSYNDYRNRNVSRRTNSNFVSSNKDTIKNKVSSPNRAKSASSIKAPLKNPTSSQKSFQSRNPSKKISSGGFGKSSSVKPSFRSSGSSKSGGFSFGK